MHTSQASELGHHPWLGSSYLGIITRKCCSVKLAQRESLGELGAIVKAVTVNEAVEADIILVAVGSVAFNDVGVVPQD
jgi:hypothetical protein